MMFLNSKLSIIILISIFSASISASAQDIDSAYIYNNYKAAAVKIIKAARADSAAWDRLAYMCDTFGSRLSGSESLNQAIDWGYDQMKKDGFTNVRKDSVKVPHWVRGEEYCLLLKPREENIPMLGLGGSIGTPPEGITAPVFVVNSFDELKENAEKVKGKILVYNMPFESYGQAVKYRFYGAIEAARAGAVASLIRSVSPYSFRQPHTGMMTYNDTVPKIPHAAIPQEDAAMLDRMQKRGQNPVIKLYMEADTLPDAISYNLMGELPGRELPGEIIALGGHSDSWDTGAGAQDDGGGCIATWQAVKLLKKLDLIPRRTLREVWWVNEENGVRGGKQYAEDHGDETHVLMFEFDSGVFPPQTIGYSGPEKLYNLIKSAEPLLKMINDSLSFRDRAWGVDIRNMVKKGVPSMNINTDDDGKYFYYHHSPKDTPDHVDPRDLNDCVAAIAIAIYIYADLPVDLRNTTGAQNESR